MVGCDKVGKTSLIRRYVTHKFTEDYSATIGMDLTVKEIDLSFGMVSHHITITLSDLAGHYRFESLHKDFLKGTDAAIIVVAQDEPESLYGKRDVHSDKVISFKDWVDRINVANPNRYVPKVLVVNKCDLEENKLSDEELKQACQENKILGAYRTSAKTGENVEKVFKTIAGIPLIRENAPPSSNSVPKL